MEVTGSDDDGDELKGAGDMLDLGGDVLEVPGTVRRAPDASNFEIRGVGGDGAGYGGTDCMGLVLDAVGSSWAGGEFLNVGGLNIDNPTMPGATHRALGSCSFLRSSGAASGVV